MPANVGKGQFHLVNQSADRKERRRKKKNRDEVTVPENVGKGQFHSVNQSANRKERRKQKRKTEMRLLCPQMLVKVIFIQ